MIGGRNMKTERAVKSLYEVESVVMIIPVSMLGFEHVDALNISYKSTQNFKFGLHEKGI